MNEAGFATSIFLFAASGGLTWLGVLLFRRWSLRRNLLDLPNDRSSHSVPTPRGGGLVIVAVSLVGYVIIASNFGGVFSWGYLVGALLIAGVSWFDDLYSLPFWSRLLVHLVAAVVLILDVGFWGELLVPVAGLTVPLGAYVGAAVTVLWLVWFVNAYNFMDGIDGIAALQAVVAFASWAALTYFFDQRGTFLFAGVATCASAGFLAHNWQPARIFMGDVGSAFLGYTLGAMPLLMRGEMRSELAVLPAVGVLFVWLFVFDTGMTLIRRVVKGEKVWEAHRQHIYQRMVIGGLTHSTVTLVYASAAALISISTVIAVVSPGIFGGLAVFCFLTATLLIVYFAIRKNVDVNL